MMTQAIRESAGHRSMQRLGFVRITIEYFIRNIKAKIKLKKRPLNQPTVFCQMCFAHIIFSPNKSNVLFN